MIKVRPMYISGNNVAKEQYEVEVGSVTIFQSYSSTIAFKSNNAWVINESYYKYSNTTSKYLNRFMKCNNSKELEGYIKDTTVELVIERDFEGLLNKATKEGLL